MRVIVLSLLFLFSVPLQALECPRIISQSPYITHTLIWLGLEECIVGVSRYDMLDLPRTGGILDPDKDALDSLMADIILTANWISEADMQKLTPEGIRFYRLNGFDSMDQIIENMNLILKLTGQQASTDKISLFQKNLNRQIQEIHANNQKALLISSCSGSPYSFGKRTWLYDLFTRIGFNMVETHTKIRHIKPGYEIDELTSLINTFKPHIVFILERKLNSKCNLILPKLPVKIITMDGRNFLHPAPVLLTGLNELNAKQWQWH